MKKIYLILSATITSAIAVAQTSTVTFENFGLQPDTFNTGSIQATNASWIGFDTLNVVFTNKYDTSFGGYWSKGFAISTKRDSVTAGFTNLYSAITASGFNSSTYAVGQNNAVIKTTNGPIHPKSTRITNTTYAALSMRNGDMFAKKFGGVTGNDSDWFLITFSGYRNGMRSGDSVTFYLADYRFSDSTQDYIVSTWQNVNLSSLNVVDSIVISLTSSDTGTFGMNTPAFYAMDNFSFDASIIESVYENRMDKNVWSIHPNPAHSVIYFKGSERIEKVSVFNAAGIAIREYTVWGNNIDVSELAEGLYYIQANSNKQLIKFIKR